MAPHISPIWPARHSITGPLVCALSAVSGGFSAVFAAHAEASGLSVSSMLALRFSIAALVLWGLVAIRRAPLPSKATMVKLAALGVIGFGVEGIFFYSALQKINPATADMLLFVYPAIVVVMGVFVRHEYFGPRKAITLGSSIAGMVLLMGAGLLGGTLAMGGVALALAAALAYAIYLVAAGGILEGVDSGVAAALVSTGAMMSMAVSSVATGSFSLPHAAWGWVWIALLALVSTVLLNILFLSGVRQIGASKAALFSCLEPVVTAITTAVAFGSSIGFAQVAGGVLVVVSIAPLQVPAKRLVALVGRRPAPTFDALLVEEAA